MGDLIGYTKDLILKLTPLRVDASTHSHFLEAYDDVVTDDGAEDIVLGVSVDGVVRAIVSKGFIPLSIIASALPRLLGAFDGELLIGSVVYDHDDEDLHTVQDIYDAGYVLGFVPKSMLDMKLEWIEDDWHDTYLQCEASRPDLEGSDLEAYTEEAFSRKHGASYEDRVREVRLRCENI